MDILSLGARVAADRAAHGWTQLGLAKQLKKLANLNKDRFADLALTKKTQNALRLWLVKLESDTLQREIGLDARDWLCDTLTATAVRKHYRTLPMNPPIGVPPKSNLPGPFRELWVFSSEPLEARDPGYAKNIFKYWTNADKSRNIVYFVPDEAMARLVHAAFETVAGGDSQKKNAMDTNLHIEVTQSAALVPHWVVFFPEIVSGDQQSGNDAQGYCELAIAPGEPRKWGAIPDRHVVNVMQTLQIEGLLGKDLQYVPPDKRHVRRLIASSMFRYYKEQ